MTDWELSSRYDYRFGGLMVQAKHGEETSPSYILRIADILRQIPDHEMSQIRKFADDNEPHYEMNELRERAITQLDLTGKTVLDVGGYDGSMAKLALDHGAARAICLDNHQYEHYGWEDKKHEGVEYVQGDFMDYTPLDNGEQLFTPQFGQRIVLPRPDVLIFYNVCYHLKNPWAAMDRLREIIKPDGVMVFCTLFRLHDGPWVYLYEPRECNADDETVYWGFSLTAIERLLTLTGWTFQREGVSYDRVVYTCRPIPGWERKHQDS